MDTALSATSETLQTFLQARLAETVPFFTSGGTMEVSLSDPHEMGRAGLQGLSLWLYRVARDDQRLNAAPRRVTHDRLEPVPLPLRLHYLISPVTSVETVPVSTRQTIVGRVLQVLYDHPVFRGFDLEGDLSGTGAELIARLEPFAVDELARVWEALDHPYQLSLSYEVSIAYVQSERPTQVIHPVQVATAEWGVVTTASEAP